jgi:N-acylneuraminate cytidylyltransferase
MGSDNTKLVVFIFARGGSKGVPRKNIKLLGDKPLIAYAIEVGLALPRVETVIVSTDDEEIAEVAKSYGAEVPFLRPAELAQDHSSEWMAWRHAVEWYEENRGPFDMFVSLPPTSPFRAAQDVENAIHALEVDQHADISITVCDSHRSPYFNMVSIDQQGYAKIVFESHEKYVRRQDVPAVFDITTVAYVARPTFIKSAKGIFSGKVVSVAIPKERSLDIDTAFDFLLAETIFKMSNTDFK